jgi:hypothetical protein
MNFVFILLILILSCGKKTDHKKGSAPQKEESVEGLYTGKFVPVNSREVPSPLGVVKMNLIQDEFHIIVAIKNLPNVKHFQSIRVGSNCPRLKDEGNIDLEIDSREVSQQTSPILIPLDADLETQTRGAGIYPFGNYRYEKIVSYSKMLSDLNALDDDEHDDVMKLSSADLPMNELIVIVEGIPEIFALPDTVQERPGMTKAASHPIACAKLVRGSEYSDEPDMTPAQIPKPIPGPIPQAPVPNPEEPHSGTLRGRIGGVIFRTWCRIYHCEAR